MTGEQLHLAPAESGDLYIRKHRKPELDVAGVITSGGRPIKIHVRKLAKHRYKRHVTGRKTPYGTQTRHHYLVMECPSCGHVVVSLYRVRHTYKSLHIWLRKAFNVRRFFKFPLPGQEWIKAWPSNRERRCAVTLLKEVKQ